MIKEYASWEPRHKSLVRLLIVIVAIYISTENTNEGTYPPINELSVIEGTLTSVKYNRKASDVLNIIDSNGIHHKLYYFIFKDQKSTIESMVGVKAKYKFYVNPRAIGASYRLAEIYLNNQRVFGDYAAVLERVSKGAGNLIVYIYWLILGALFLLTFANKKSKEEQ